MPRQVYDIDLARVECGEIGSLPGIIDDVSKGPSDGSIPHLAMYSTIKRCLLSPGGYSLQLFLLILWTVQKQQLTPGSSTCPIGQVEAE